jgi:DNA-binding HxlR family transcriptional regulator
LVVSAEPVCPDFHEAVELIGRRWSGAIVFALCERPMRFAEIAACVTGISDRLLSRRLRELEEAGIVERHVSSAPVRVTYSLTDKGAALEPVLRRLREWAREWKAAGDGGEPRVEAALPG